MYIEKTTDPALVRDAFPFVADLDRFYPGFRRWYQDKVLPGVSCGADTMLLAIEGGILAGVAFGKRSADECKLRCVRVAPRWQNSGLGLRLIERMFDELGTDRPACTVAEELFHQYSRPFIQRCGFELSAVDKGRYRRHKLEYSFNGG